MSGGDLGEHTAGTEVLLRSSRSLKVLKVRKTVGRNLGRTVSNLSQFTETSNRCWSRKKLGLKAVLFKDAVG